MFVGQHMFGNNAKDHLFPCYSVKALHSLEAGTRFIWTHFLAHTVSTLNLVTLQLKGWGLYCDFQFAHISLIFYM